MHKCKNYFTILVRYCAQPEVSYVRDNQNLGVSKKESKRESERRYNEYLDDPVTFAIDEVLQTLGPRQEQIRR